MSDQPPTAFGPFVIQGSLGAGAMGEVYRARDARLNRDVAIKVLGRAASDPARRRRLSDEARAVSALNHPNILTVFDVGEQDGAPYIVAELIEGSSVRALVARAPLSVREVLDLGAQMADGLAAAHQAGIVHRDFKPENVMVTPEGRVKILDFGLALAGMSGGGGSDLDATLTSTHVIAGTVPYMSPEQARGAVVDYRTDQFSFGLVLYELVTGRRAFKAETAAQTLAAILEDEPEPIAKLNPRVPAPLRWVIERCLAKDPRQRYESTADLARELRTLRDRVGEFSTSSELPAQPIARRWRSTMLIAGATVAVSAGLLVAALNVVDVPPFNDYRFTPFATDPGFQGSPEWSPDGKTLVYVGEADGVLQVFTKAVGSPLRAQVTHARFDCHWPFWAPDGTRLYFMSLARDRESLWSVSAIGGAPELVVENVTRAAISPDGKTLALWRPSDNDYAGVYTLWFSSPPGSQPTEYRRQPFGSMKFLEGVLHFSPDSSVLGVSATFLDTSGLPTKFWIVPMKNADPYIAHQYGGFVAAFSWLPDSRRLVSALNYPRPGIHLWLNDTKGTETRLIVPSGAIENEPAVSPDGTRLALSAQATNYDVYRLSIEHPTLDPVLVSARNEMDPTWSLSAGQMAFITDRSGMDEIWLRSQDGEFERPLVVASDAERPRDLLLRSVSFSPDGRRIAYLRSTPAGERILIEPVAGGPPVELSKGTLEQQDMPSWSPDGAWLAYSHNSNGVSGKWSLSKARVGASVAPVVLAQNIAPVSPVKWAPKGDWIAFNGEDGLSVVTPDGQSNRVITEQPWLAFDWSEDGRQLLGIRQSDDQKHLAFAAIDIRSGVETVFAANLTSLPVASEPVRGFSRVSRTTFLTSIIRVSSDIWLLDGFNPSKSVWDRYTRRLRLHSN